DGVKVAVEHLEQQVSSQSVQASGPPFDPFIYRTSPATFHSRRYCARQRSEKISLLNKNLFHCRVRFHPLQEKNAFPTRSELRSGVPRARRAATERAAESTEERRGAFAASPNPHRPPPERSAAPRSRPRRRAAAARACACRRQRGGEHFRVRGRRKTSR